MSEQSTFGSRWLGGFLLALVVGAVVVLVDAGLQRPAPFGLRVTRVGQLLFVIAFVAGSFHFLRRGRDWRAVGFMFIAVGWALLFADWLLEQLVGPAYVFGVLAILVAGSVTIVYGIVQDELRSEPDLEALLGG